ncbi:MAG TPA: MFS transporter [Sediminispirochaeta sp.]|nr:MFS transporter [Sediminispirochaeta sp.]
MSVPKVNWQLHKVFTQYAGLPRAVYVLFFARIINRMGDFVHFFLTLFLTQKMGMSEGKTGTFLMLVSFSRMAGSVFSGKLGDHIGRKRGMVFFLACFALTLTFTGFVVESMLTPYMLILAGFFNGGERPLNNTIVTDLTRGEQRNKAFSLLYLGINIGVAIGPMIAGFLFNRFIRWIFWGDAITSLIAILLIVAYVPESRPSAEELEESKKDPSSKERAEEGGTIGAFLRRPVLALSTLLMILSGFIYSQHAFALPLHLDQLFGRESARLFGLIMSSNAVYVLLFTTLILYLTKKINPLKSTALGALLYAGGFGMIFFLEDFYLFFLSTLIWTLGEIITMVNYNVFIASHTPISHRSRFNGLLQVILGMGFAVGPFLAGLFVDLFGTHDIWLVVSALGVVVYFGFLALAAWEKKRAAAEVLESPTEKNPSI